MCVSVDDCIVSHTYIRACNNDNNTWWSSDGIVSFVVFVVVLVFVVLVFVSYIDFIARKHHLGYYREHVQTNYSRLEQENGMLLRNRKAFKETSLPHEGAAESAAVQRCCARRADE